MEGLRRGQCWQVLRLRAVRTETLIKWLVAITLILALYGAGSLALTIASHV